MAAYPYRVKKAKKVLSNLKVPRRRYFFREWRKYRKLNQDTAGERIGKDQSTLSRIERGEVPFDQDFLESAAFAYQCEPADLLMRDPTDQDAVWSIMDNLKTATLEEKKQVVRIVGAALKRTGT